MMKKNIIAVFTAIVLLLTFVMVFIFNTKKDVITSILYSWHMSTLNDEQLNDVITLLNVDEIYQHFSSDYLNNSDNEFIKKMNLNNINVYHLCGDPSWDTSDKIIEEIDKVKKYNSNNYYKISGIVLDIESYSKKDFDQKKYLKALKEAYKYAKSNNIYVVLDIPTWLEKYGDDYLEDIISSTCDEISIMNYNINKTISSIEKEVEYALLYNKKVNTIYEINFNEEGYFKDYNSIKDDYIKLNSYYNKVQVKIAFHHYDSIIENMNN